MHVAVLRDRHAAHELHHEVRTSAFGGTAVVDTGDARVIHHRQRLTFGLEAGHDLFCVHPLFDDLQRDPPRHGLGLLGEVHDAHAAFAQRFEDLVGSDLHWPFF